VPGFQLIRGSVEIGGAALYRKARVAAGLGAMPLDREHPQKVERPAHRVDDRARIAGEERIERLSAPGGEELDFRGVRIGLHDQLERSAALPGNESLSENGNLNLGPPDGDQCVLEIGRHICQCLPLKTSGSFVG
jgi:hypothetical protein